MWYDIAAIDELPPGQQLRRNLGGRNILLVATATAIYALENRCPHADFPLYGGKVDDGVIQCPTHGARFDLASGEVLRGPIGSATIYPIIRQEGRILVEIEGH
ncbi:MAG: Rieske 2Fe-2S domain-containing protein [Pseudomonadales bacterium]